MPDPEALVFTFKPTKSDHVRAAREMYRYGARTLRARLFIVVLIVGGSLLLAGALGVVGGLSLLTILIFALLIGVAAAAGGVIGRHVQWLLQARQLQRLPVDQRTFTYTIDSKGLRGRFFQSEISVDWVAFADVIETDTFFLMLCQPSWGYYLAKNTIDGGEELSAVRAIIRSGFGRLRNCTTAAAA